MAITSLWKRNKSADISNRLALTSIGINATLGIGIFLIVGYVARSVAGPAVVVSVAIAAATSMLSGKYSHLSIFINQLIA